MLKVRTSVKQAFLHLLALLGVSDKSYSHGDSLARQKSIILAVCEGPYLAEDGRLKLRTAKSLDGSVTGDDTELVRISTRKEGIHECQLCLSRRKRGRHGAYLGREYARYDVEGKAGFASASLPPRAWGRRTRSASA